MIRNRIFPPPFAKRTMRLIFPHNNNMPKAGYLGDFGSDICPGMVASGSWQSIYRFDGKNFPIGLFAHFANNQLDELGGGTEIGIWTSGIFELLDNGYNCPLLKSTAKWSSMPKQINLYATYDGLITHVPTPWKIGQLIEAISDEKIIIDLDISPDCTDDIIAGRTCITV